MSLELLGKPFFGALLNDISDLRLDAKCWMIDTADNIFAYPKIPGQFILPRTTGHGYTKNVPFFINVDGSGEIPLGIKKHSHARDLDTDGGLMIDQYLGNIGNLDVYMGNSFNKNDFYTETSGTGAQVIDAISGTAYHVEADSGTSSGGYATFRRPGVAMDFTKKSAFAAREELNGTIANYLLRIGIDAERPDLANDPTQQSYGIEACNGQTNWQTWSCDGVNRSTTPTVYPVDTNANVWFADHDPQNLQILFTKNRDTGSNQVTKGSDVPNSGISASLNYFGGGIKSTTTSQAKKLRHRGAIVAANIGLVDWKYYLA